MLGPQLSEIPAPTRLTPCFFRYKLVGQENRLHGWPCSGAGQPAAIPPKLAEQDHVGPGLGGGGTSAGCCVALLAPVVTLLESKSDDH